MQCERAGTQAGILSPARSIDRGGSPTNRVLSLSIAHSKLATKPEGTSSNLNLSWYSASRIRWEWLQVEPRLGAAAIKVVRRNLKRSLTPFINAAHSSHSNRPQLAHRLSCNLFVGLAAFTYTLMTRGAANTDAESMRTRCSKPPPRGRLAVGHWGSF